MTSRHPLILVLVATALLATCTPPAPQSTLGSAEIAPPTYTPAATWTPAATYTPVPTWTPVPTYTSLPTFTPTPTSVPPTPTSAPASPTPLPVAGIWRAVSRPAVLEYGIQAHGEHKLPEVVYAVQDLGMTWIKQQVRWEQIEGTQGVYGWTGLDHIVDTYHRAGFKVLLSVTAAPDWTRPGKPGDGPPDDYGEYARFVGLMAKRYQGRVHAYEVWNEPNLRREWNGAALSAGSYVRLLKGAYGAIKGADPQAVVVSAALSPTGVYDVDWAINDRDYLLEMYKAGVKAYCDALGAHPYGHANPPEVYYGGGDLDPEREWDDHPSFFFRNTMEDYYAIMVAHGDRTKKIWVTGFGWPTVYGMDVGPTPGQEYAADLTEDQQADYVVRAYVWAREWGHAKVMLLGSLNYWAAAGPYSEMAKYSLLRADGSPRQAYVALRNMLRQRKETQQ